MMGREEPECEDLFSYGINLERRVRANHLLRKIKETIDFEFIYSQAAAGSYYRGRAVDPEIPIFKKQDLSIFSSFS